MVPDIKLWGIIFYKLKSKALYIFAPSPSKCCVGRGSKTEWKKFRIRILRLRIYKICFNVVMIYSFFFLSYPSILGWGVAGDKKIHIWYFHSESKYLENFYLSRKVFWNIFHTYLLMGRGGGTKQNFITETAIFSFSYISISLPPSLRITFKISFNIHAYSIYFE